MASPYGHNLAHKGFAPSGKIHSCYNARVKVYRYFPAFGGEYDQWGFWLCIGHTLAIVNCRFRGGFKVSLL